MIMWLTNNVINGAKDEKNPKSLIDAQVFFEDPSGSARKCCSIRGDGSSGFPCHSVSGW